MRETATGQSMIKLPEKIKNKLPDTVVEMWIGEVLFGLLCQLIGIFLVKERLGYSIGLWCGVILTIFCTWHMWSTIDRSLTIADEKSAGKYVGSRYVIRYFALIVMVAVLYITGWGNAFAAFLGYMGMKPAAYLAPFIHNKIRR